MNGKALPTDLEERIRFYEDPANDPGGFTPSDWRLLVGAGVLLPIVCIILAWTVGWPA
jgi:hypothetical protein